MCKTLERMLNTRFLDYFYINKTLYNIQCGGRAKRSTTDDLVRVESAVRETFVKDEFMVSNLNLLYLEKPMTQLGGMAYFQGGSNV